MHKRCQTLGKWLLAQAVREDTVINSILVTSAGCIKESRKSSSQPNARQHRWNPGQARLSRTQINTVLQGKHLRRRFRQSRSSIDHEWHGHIADSWGAEHSHWKFTHGKGTRTGWHSTRGYHVRKGCSSWQHGESTLSVLGEGNCPAEYERPNTLHLKDMLLCYSADIFASFFTISLLR